MVTINQKSTIDTHTKKRYKHKHSTKDSHQVTRERNKRRRKKQKRTPKTINKMAISIYLSVITLNVNRLNVPIKRHRVAEWIQKQDPYIYAAYRRFTSDLKTQTD